MTLTSCTDCEDDRAGECAACLKRLCFLCAIFLMKDGKDPARGEYPLSKSYCGPCANNLKKENKMADSTQLIPGAEIVLGDIVQMFEGPYGWGTVVKIEAYSFDVFRVYVHVSDFDFTGGLIPYTGHELVSVSKNGTYKVDSYAHKIKKEDRRMHETG